MNAHERLISQLQEESSDDDDDAIAVCLVNNLRDEEEEDSSVQKGSQEGKRPNLARDFNKAVSKIRADYFGDNPLYPEEFFERRFRMPVAVFDRVYSKISVLPFFQ